MSDTQRESPVSAHAGRRVNMCAHSVLPPSGSTDHCCSTPHSRHASCWASVLCVLCLSCGSSATNSVCELTAHTLHSRWWGSPRRAARGMGRRSSRSSESSSESPRGRRRSRSARRARSSSDSSATQTRRRRGRASPSPQGLPRRQAPLIRAPCRHRPASPCVPLRE